MDSFITTVTQKGQVTLPVAMRRKAKIGNKTPVEIKFRQGKITVEPVIDFFSLAGTIKPVPGKSVMDARKEMEDHYERF
jgi:bifunctional DNA-binding transcriptional regulator/antitoxin component of YhaV-PrlF toxin-antitoxin module